MKLTCTIFLAMVAWASPVSAQDNLLTNPGFEEEFGPNNRWRAAAVPPVVFERTDDQAFSGSWSGRASNRSQQWHGPFYGLSADGLFGDGGWFQIRVRAKADNSEGQSQLRLLLQINDEREECPAELPFGAEFCFCYDLTPTDRSCAYGVDSALSDASTWVELEWTGPVEFLGDVSFYQFQIDTLEGEPFPDLYVDEASVINLTTVFGDRFEATD
jgi:hypothetical protein